MPLALVMELLIIAQGLRATTYGYGEFFCGVRGRPRPCIKGEPTSSGEEFDPDIATAALPAPGYLHFKPFYVRVKNHTGRCVSIRVNDKANPKWIGVRGLDLSPRAVELITGNAYRHWSGKLQFCHKNKERVDDRRLPRVRKPRH